MLQRTPKRRRAQGGFTLIEVTIAMVVFAITITAITAMNTTSLQAANTSLLTQEGGAVADQFMEMLSVDALRWKTNSRAGLRYLGGNTAYQITNGPTTQWNRYTKAPVNYQMRYDSHKNASINPGRSARYCVYFSYQWAGKSANVNSFQEELLELNVVVLTPRDPNGLSNSTSGCANAQTRFSTCDAALMTDSSCSLTARRQQFVRLSRAMMIRRNRSGF